MCEWIMLLYTWNKQTNKQSKNTLQHCKSHLHQKNTSYKKRMLTVFLSGLSELGCCHIPEAWAGLSPLAGLSWGWGRWGGCASQWALPMDLACLFPSAPAHNFQIQAGPPAVKLHLLHPKEVELLGWKSFGKPPWAPCLQVMVFPPPASFLRVTPPMIKALSTEGCRK